MPSYIIDRNQTANRLADLKASLDFAEYELHAAIGLAKAQGMTWLEIGEALGFGAAKQSAFKLYSRSKMDVGMLAVAERERIHRLIGIGERVSRYAVREIESGRPGITKVVRRTLSVHLRRDVAERKCRERGKTAELWQLDPDGSERQLTITPERPTRVIHAHREPTTTDDSF